MIVIRIWLLYVGSNLADLAMWLLHSEGTPAFCFLRWRLLHVLRAMNVTVYGCLQRISDLWSTEGEIVEWPLSDSFWLHFRAEPEL